MIMTLRKLILKVCFIGLILIFVTACGNKKKTNSNETTSTEMAEKNIYDELPIYTDLSLENIRSSKKGDTLNVMLKGRDEVMHLIVRENKEVLPGIVSFRADVDSVQKGLASFAVRNDELSGTITLYSENAYFKVNLDTLKEAYILTKHSIDSLDTLPGSAPLVPPSKQTNQIKN